MSGFSLRRMLARCVGALLFSGACAGSAQGAVVVGQIDTFEGTSTENWQVGSAGTGFSPLHVASGGPGGAGDGFMRVRSNGNQFGGAFSRLAVFNEQQWTGSWNGGFGGIRVDVTNLGATDVKLRLVLRDALNNTHVSKTPIDLPAGAGWRSGLWVLNGADFTSSGSSLDAARANILEMRFVHHTADTGGLAGTIVLADIGVDNIEAVVIPEPGVMGLVVGAMGLVVWRRRS
jgi:hypothetical protein